jgi:7-cyano-7-deazaguanine synthase
LPSAENKRAVALVSGGLDSVVSLAAGLADLEVRLVLFFNYGQGALEREREAVLGVVNYYQLPFREVDLGWLGGLAPEGFCPGPAGAAVKRAGALEELDDVWVPNRNGVFLNVAAAFAESYGCRTVITGFNREEAEEFPDNREVYVEAVNRGFKSSTRNGVEVRSYTQRLDKKDILRLGLKLRTPLSIVWSCYRAGAVMCGRCASCRRLRRALAALPAGERPRLEFGDEQADEQATEL